METCQQNDFDLSYPSFKPHSSFGWRGQLMYNANHKNQWRFLSFVVAKRQISIWFKCTLEPRKQMKEHNCLGKKCKHHSLGLERHRLSFIHFLFGDRSNLIQSGDHLDYLWPVCFGEKRGHRKRGCLNECFSSSIQCSYLEAFLDLTILVIKQFQ